MRTVDIVGNGPSRKLWEPREGIFSIGCNEATDTDIVALHDEKFLTMTVAGTFKAQKPLILGGDAFAKLNEFPRTKRRWRVVGHIDRPESQVKPMNSGQDATLWALRLGYDDVHLWGFDSLWTGQRTSSSAHLWNPKNNAHHDPDKPAKAPGKWDDGWAFIYTEYPEAEFTVHVDGERDFIMNRNSTPKIRK